MYEILLDSYQEKIALAFTHAAAGPGHTHQSNVIVHTFSVSISSSSTVVSCSDS